MWADFVNKASGRGDLGKLQGAANILSIGFFAPRFAVSRFQAPAALIKYRKNPLVRKMILKELGATVGVGMTALGLMSLRDDVEVSADPRSADFGKIKIGNTRYDIWGGFQQSARLVAQMFLTGKDAVMGEAPKDPVKLLEQFTEFKLSPAAQGVRQLITGKDPVGKEKTRWETLGELPVPIIATDIADAVKEGGAGQAIPAGITSLLGIGVSTYEQERKRASANRYNRYRR
jgi:hypothetical protein